MTFFFLFSFSKIWPGQTMFNISGILRLYGEKNGQSSLIRELVN